MGSVRRAAIGAAQAFVKFGPHIDVVHWGRPSVRASIGVIDGCSARVGVSLTLDAAVLVRLESPSSRASSRRPTAVTPASRQRIDAPWPRAASLRAGCFAATAPIPPPKWGDQKRICTHACNALSVSYAIRFSYQAEYLSDLSAGGSLYLFLSRGSFCASLV
jgi:hypothetical protein